MSRDLPAMPNLEHLKKQAKKRLHELQQGSPDTKLAHAQHAIAKEYGFTSWEDLRGVSPLPSSVEVPFSNETKQILLSAVEEAGRLSHRDIGMSHMLLGILRDERSVAASVLIRKGLHRDAIQKAAVSLAGEDRQP